MLPVNEVLVVAAVVLGVLLIAGGTMLARKPETRVTQTPPEQVPAPWWTELLGPDAVEPTPEQQAEMLGRLRLLDSDWARTMLSKAPVTESEIEGQLPK